MTIKKYPSKHQPKRKSPQKPPKPTPQPKHKPNKQKQKSDKKKSCLCRLCRYAKWVSAGGVLLGLSTFTPIFALTVGSGLSVIGDWYGQKERISNTHLANHTHADSTDTDHVNANNANAYVVLGGGLTQDDSHAPPIITLNAYSYQRTQTLWHAWQKTPLPVIASGVEAPWIANMLSYLGQKDSHPTPDVISEKLSMNTCENARFSAKLIKNLSEQGKLPAIAHVYLVSDWYHMARARRQFALSGLATTPLVAPLPTALSWTDYRANLNHSRRAFYEAAALLRDIFRPQKNCRQADSVG